MITNEQVLDRYYDLASQGAVVVEASFSVAGQGRADVIYDGRRLLITPNDEDYATYADVMQRSGLPYVANDSGLGDESVVVGLLPRDVRSFPKVMRGLQADGGVNAVSLFFEAGRSIDHMINIAKVAPAIADISISRTLVLRDRGEVLWVPPIQFETVDEETKNDLLTSMGEQLNTGYARFGAVALLRSFEQGLQG